MPWLFSLSRLRRAGYLLASRRGLVARLFGGLFAVSALGHVTDIEGKKKRHKKKKKKRKKKKQPQTTRPPQLVYACSGPGLGDDPNDGNRRTAQTFRPGSSGLLRQIVLPINMESGSLGDYIVQLLAVDPGTGVPSHLTEGVLAEAIIPNSSVPAGVGLTLTAEFNGPQLQQGALYAAALSRPGPDDYLNYSWSGDGSACSGNYFSSVNGAPFGPVAMLDSVVSVFIA